MTIADELIAILGYETRGEAEAAKYERRIDGLTKKLDNFAVTAGRLAGLASAAIATGFGLLGKSVIETSAQFETYETTLTTIEGSAEKARQSLDWISDFGKTTPYEVGQVTDAFVKLKAYGIDPIADDALRKLGDTASAMGKPLEQAVEAFADAATGEFERLKEFGIKAKTVGDDVTFSWTDNGEELTKTVKKNSTEIRGFLLETLGGRFQGAMDRQSRTFTGMVSNLGDTWTDFKRRIGEAGFFDSVTGNLEKLLNWLNRLDEDGTLDRWAKNISNVLTKASDFIGLVAGRIAKHAMFIAENFETLEPILTPIAVALGLLMVKAFPLISIFTFLALALEDFLTYLQGGESYIGDFIEWLQDFVGVSEDMAEKIAAMAAATLGFTLMAGPVRTLAAAFRLLATGITSATAAAGVKKLSGIGRGLVAMLSTTAGITSSVIGGSLAGLYANGQALDREKADSMGDTDRARALRAEHEQTVMSQRMPEGSFGSRQTPGISKEQAGKITAMLERNRALAERSSGPGAVAATLNDSRSDNRQFPLTNNVTVNQTVTNATDAPMSAAQATGNAVAGEVSKQRTQAESEPSF